MTGLTDRHVKSAFRYRSRTQEMFSDPDLQADTLLAGLAILNRLQLGVETGEKYGERFWDLVLDDTGWRQHSHDAWFRMRRAIAKDVPRYQIDGLDQRQVVCEAPMIRRPGSCGQRSSVTTSDRDPTTGAGKLVGFCGRHRHLVRDVRARQLAWVANGRPEPPHNAGGALARYFSGLTPMYVWANYGQDLTPGTGKTAIPPRPTLTLIRGGAA